MFIWSIVSSECRSIQPDHFFANNAAYEVGSSEYNPRSSNREWNLKEF